MSSISLFCPFTCRLARTGSLTSIHLAVFESTNLPLMKFFVLPPSKEVPSHSRAVRGEEEKWRIRREARDEDARAGRRRDMAIFREEWSRYEGSSRDGNSRSRLNTFVPFFLLPCSSASRRFGALLSGIVRLRIGSRRNSCRSTIREKTVTRAVPRL